MRGGFVPIQIAELQGGESFPELSHAALGAWVRLRAQNELLGGPIGQVQLDRLAIADQLEELLAAGVVSDDAHQFEAVGMPDPRKPSDEPARVRARVAAYRARKALLQDGNAQVNSTPVSSTQVKSSQLSKRVTGATCTNDVVTPGIALQPSGDKGSLKERKRQWNREHPHQQFPVEDGVSA